MSATGGRFYFVFKNPDRLRQLREAFVQFDVEENGRLNKEKWSTVLRRCGVEHSDKDLVQAFNQAGRSLDSDLSLEEFLGQETKEEMAFKVLDTNGDGFVSRAEFERLSKKRLTKEQMDLVFVKFDKDGNGKLSFSEFSEMMNARKVRKKATPLAEEEEEEEGKSKEVV